MRRKDREITDFDQIIAILQKCLVVRLGLVDDGEPYVVPLNFGYETMDGKLTLYFHSAAQGRKIDIIKVNDKACFEADQFIATVTGEKACDWSTKYESVIGFGRVSFIEDEGEQKKAMDAIMHHHGFEGEPSYPPNIFRKMALYKMDVERLSGKSNADADR